jgi:hypothetical protein
MDFVSRRNALKHKKYRNIWIQRAVNLLSSLFNDLTEKGYERFTIQEQDEWITASFVFAIIWTVGASISTFSAVEFSAFLRNRISLNALQIAIPPDLLVFDYYFDTKRLKWIRWLAKATKATLSAIVETEFVIKGKFLSRICLTNNLSVLFSGKTAVGKSTIAKVSLSDLHSFDISQNISAGSANFAKNLEEIVSRSSGRKLLVFVDDLNTSSDKNLEFMRFYVETRDNVKFVSTRTVLSDDNTNFDLKLLKNFVEFNVTDDTQPIIQQIFEMLTAPKPFAKSTQNLSSMLNFSLFVFKKVNQTPEMLRIFQFDLNDILNVFRHLCQECGQEHDDVLQRWENCIAIVFGGKLCNQGKGYIFDKALVNITDFPGLPDHLCQSLTVLKKYSSTGLPNFLLHEPLGSRATFEKFLLDLPKFKLQNLWYPFLFPEKILEVTNLAFTLHCLNSHVLIHGSYKFWTLPMAKLASQMIGYDFVAFDGLDWNQSLINFYRSLIHTKSKKYVVFVDRIASNICVDLLSMMQTGFPTVADNMEFEESSETILGTSYIDKQIESRFKIVLYTSDMREEDFLQFRFSYPQLFSKMTVLNIGLPTQSDIYYTLAKTLHIQDAQVIDVIATFFHWVLESFSVIGDGFQKSNSRGDLYYGIYASVYVFVNNFNSNLKELRSTADSFKSSCAKIDDARRWFNELQNIHEKKCKV